MKALRHPGLHWLLGIALGGVFIYASYDKILKPPDFAKIVYHYQLIGPSHNLSPLPANFLAVTLPWVEIVTGLMLVTGFWRREAAVVAGLMLVMFIGAVGFALMQGIDIENCGCFSVEGKGRDAGLMLIGGDLLMLAAAAILALAPPRRLEREAPATEAAPASS